MAVKRPRRSSKARSPAERLELKLDSTLQSVDLAERLVRRFCKKVGCNEQQQNEIGLAVRETVANAVYHGNGCDARKKVSVAAERRKSGVVISVRDEGPGFDPESVPDPLDPANLLRASGRGVFLIRATMDEVKLRRLAARGMEITLVKHFSNSGRRTKR